MKKFAASLVYLLSLISGTTNACSDAAAAQASVENLSVIAASFNISEGDGHRMITSLGTLKNSSAACFDSIVVEVKYFDAKNALVDTITQPLYGLVAPSSKDVAFRVRDDAAMAKEAYASQSLRVVSADARHSKTQSNSSTIVDFLASWGPMLLLIGVWIFFMQRTKSKNSPQSKTLALFEKQNATLEAQNQLLERIAAASEARTRAQGGT